MDGIPAFMISIALAYGYAVSARRALQIRGSTGLFVSIIAGVVVLFIPLLIPADRIGLRALGAFLCAELMFKMVDYARQYNRTNEDAARLTEYLRFLIPFPVLLVVFGLRRRRPWVAEHRTKAVAGLMISIAVFVMGFVLVHSAARIDAVRSYFLLDHAIKFVIFVMTIEALSRAIYCVERLAGFDTTPLIVNAYRAKSVGDFWQRFNTRVHTWFDHNVFRRVGGRRAPVSGVLLCFFISAAMHELMFGIATSRFDGYQFAFFMLQAPAVLVVRPLHRLAGRGGIAGGAVGHGTTVIWFFFTSMFFFHGVDRVFPFFYASDPWLP